MTESDRIINLEHGLDKLSELVAQTTLSVQSLSEEMKEFKAEAKRDRKQADKKWEEFKAEAERDRKEFKAEAERDRKEFKAEAERDRKEFKAEAERDRKEFKNDMNKKWGELANSMGRVVEYLIIPNVDFLTPRFFKNEAYTLYHDIYKKKGDGTGKQFDGILISETKFFLIEVKTNIRKEDVIEFKEFIDSGEIKKYFAEAKGKQLIPMMGSIYLKPHQVEWLTDHNIYALDIFGDILTIKNFDRIKMIKI
jgi:F0F1-type ATP synthase membrane subunit b/b'